MMTPRSLRILTLTLTLTPRRPCWIDLRIVLADPPRTASTLQDFSRAIVQAWTLILLVHDSLDSAVWLTWVRVRLLVRPSENRNVTM